VRAKVVVGIRGEVGKPQVCLKAGRLSAPREQHLGMKVLRLGVEAWLYSRVAPALLMSPAQLNDPASTLARRFSSVARQVPPC
jgi:hypothetical protein